MYIIQCFGSVLLWIRICRKYGTDPCRFNTHLGRYRKIFLKLFISKRFNRRGRDKFLFKVINLCIIYYCEYTHSFGCLLLLSYLIRSYTDPDCPKCY